MSFYSVVAALLHVYLCYSLRANTTKKFVPSFGEKKCTSLNRLMLCTVVFRITLKVTIDIKGWGLLFFKVLF